MPEELRFIMFNLEEIQQAMAVYSVKSNSDAPPEGTLQHIRIDKEGEKADQLLLEFRLDDGAEIKKEFTREFFAHALVFYCQAHNIPIPRAGTKILKIEPEQITMKIDLPRQNV